MLNNTTLRHLLRWQAVHRTQDLRAMDKLLALLLRILYIAGSHEVLLDGDREQAREGECDDECF